MRKGRILFSRPQMLILAKLLGIYGQRETTTREIANPTLIGESLLAINDLIQRDHRAKNTDLVKDPLKSLAHTLISDSYMIQGYDARMGLVSSRKMYLQIHSTLGKKPPSNYVDIGNQFRARTGMDLPKYMDIGTAIVAWFYSRPASTTVLESAHQLGFPVDSFFKNTNLGKKTLAQFFKLTSLSGNGFCAKANNQKNDSRRLTHDFLFIKQKPLVQVGLQMIPLSIDYLFEKLTTGIYWTIVDQLDNAENHLADRFRSYNGYLFERYAQDLLEIAFANQPGSADELHFEQIYHVGKQEQRTADAIVVGPGHAILFEVSATRLQARNTVSLGLEEAFFQDCEKIVFHNVKSLDNFISNVKNGHYRGIPNGSQIKLYPVIVTVEGFPRHYLLDAYIFGEIEQRGWLLGTNTAPLSMLSIHDLEYLTLNHKLNIAEAFDSWHKNPRFPHISITEHLRNTHESPQAPSREWFEDSLDEIFDDASKTVFGQTVIS